MKDGNWGLFSVRAIPLMNPDKSIREWVGVHTNITQKRKFETILKQSEERFRSLANSMSQLAWMATKNGSVYWYNQRWIDYTGTSLQEMQGWGWEKVHHPDYVERIVTLTKELWNINEPFELTFPLRRHDGVYRWFLTRAYPITNQHGEIIQWVGTKTDIDDYKKAIELKDQFLRVASHELKTPVTSLKGYTQLLQMTLEEEGVNANTAKLVQKMDQQIDKLTGLIVNLLDVTKIENGQLQYLNENFNFNLLVLETVEELQRTTQTHLVKTQLDDAVNINGDRTRIGQVIANLLTNAIKYSPGNNVIIVSTEIKANEITLSVQDFGLGIPKTDIPFIFDRFYRITGNHRETYPGLGLGLFIAAETIRRHHGQINVTSKEGIGSTFRFNIPLK